MAGSGWFGSACPGVSLSLSVGPSYAGHANIARPAGGRSGGRGVVCLLSWHGHLWPAVRGGPFCPCVCEYVCRSGCLALLSLPPLH